jgi:tetratricopeptide (TPR) repeat protein
VSNAKAAVRKPVGTSMPRRDIAFLDEAGYVALLAAADRALAKDSANRSAFYRKAVALGFLGRVAEACQAMAALLALGKPDPRYLFLDAGLRSLAQMSSARGHHTEESVKEGPATTDKLRAVIALQPGTVAAWLATADLLKSIGATADQVSLLRLGARRSWRDTASLGALGDQLQECGDYAAAAECYDRALRVGHGSTVHALTQLAWFMVAWGHPDTARLLLDDARAGAPHDREVLFAGYYLENQEGRLEEALACIREVNALRRSRETGEAELGLLGRLGRTDEQLAMLESFIQSEKDDALRSRWMARKARVLLERGEVDAAMTVAKWAASEDSRTGPAVLIWAMTLERKGRHEDALRALDMCSDVKELLADIDYWLTRSSAFSGMMDWEKALESAREATRRSPDDERGWKQVLFLSRRIGRPKDGAPAVRNLLECKDQDCEFLSAMVLSLMAVRWYGAAGQFADRLVAAAPTDPDTLYLLGSLYSRMGNQSKADECFAASENAEGGAAQCNTGGAPHE